MMDIQVKLLKELFILQKYLSLLIRINPNVTISFSRNME